MTSRQPRVPGTVFPMARTAEGQRSVFDLALDDVEQAIVETARALALGPVAQAASAADREQVIGDRCVRALHEFGFTCPLPEALGGSGLPSPFQQVLALEALGYGDPGVTGVLTLSSAAALVIGQCGTQEQQQSWLAGVADRSHAVVPLGLYESYGREPDEFETTITPQGDNRWRVHGRKVGVAVGGPDPSHILVVARAAEDEGLRAAFVPIGADGVSLRHDVNPEASQGFIAMSQARFATLDVDTVVETGDLLGHGRADRAALTAAVARTRLLPAAITLGGAARAREYATAYAVGREAFGTVIHEFQGVSFPLVDSQIKIDAARLSLWKAALDLEVDSSTSAIGSVVNECHAAANAATREAMQTLGGHGFLTDHPVERWYRCAAMFSALDTDPVYTRFELAV